MLSSGRAEIRLTGATERLFLSRNSSLAYGPAPEQLLPIEVVPHRLDAIEFGTAASGAAIRFRGDKRILGDEEKGVFL
jgi:hypothetical protein